MLCLVAHATTIHVAKCILTEKYQTIINSGHNKLLVLVLIFIVHTAQQFQSGCLQH